jgi:hypothetical protein
MKGKFRIIAKQENIITNKGVKAFVMEKLLNSPFQNAAVLNVGSKTVEVQIEGEKEKVFAFIKELKRGISEEFGNPLVSFTEFEENPLLEVPSLLRSSQAFSIGQLQKGIGVQLKIFDSLEEMKQEFKGMKNDLKALPERIGVEIREMRADLKTLPERIAEAFRKA